MLRRLILPALLPLAASALTLQSTDIADGMAMSARHESNARGCHGDNISPQLEWDGVPPATRSFALTVFDPDARKGAGWWHWLLVDLPADTRALPGGAGSPGGILPHGSRSLPGSGGVAGFAGACPPAGDPPHRYRFTLWALDVPVLPVTTGTPIPDVLDALRAHAIDQAGLVPRYARP